MKLYLVKNGYRIFRCPTCQLGQTQLDQDYLKLVKQLYTKGFFTGDPKAGAYVNYEGDKPHIVRNLRNFLDHVRKVKPSGKLLDVGCATGFFIEEALKAGYDAFGFDPSDYAVNLAKRRFPDRVKHGTIGQVSYPPKFFDVITLFDVIEHLSDPKQDLARLQEWLRDDGIIVIATGNTASAFAKLMRRRWTFYIPPQHLFFFNRANFTDLLMSERLRPKNWFHIAKWLSTRYVLHLARVSGESRLAARIYPYAERSWWGLMPVYLPVRDNMVVIAGKFHEKTDKG